MRSTVSHVTSRLDPARPLSRPSGLLRRLAATYRRTGADVPYGDPLPSHGTKMEGWFWRLTDPTSGRVIVALCGVNRHPAGDWATVAVAVHPGHVVHSAVLELAAASRDELLISAGTATGDRIEATADQLHIELGDLRLDVEFTNSFDWPKGLGGGGLFSALPYLNQYWHPYRLGGTATGHLEHGGDRWQLDNDTVYAERNWGAGFPDLWWWGQAHDFPGHDLSVVFTGGLLRLGPIGRPVGGVVLRHGDQVIRITPPALVRSDITPNRWVITARSLRYRIQLEGSGLGIAPHVLPVPIPDERRNVDLDFEHLAGRLRCTLHRRGRLILDATSDLAGLEVGSLFKEPAMRNVEARPPKLPPPWFKHTFWRAHRLLYRLSGGHFLWTPASKRGWGALYLTTIGRKSGRERRVIVGYLEDGPNLVTLAMNGFDEGHPAWWLNLEAHPDAVVRIARRPERPVHARAATGEERDRLWQRWVTIDPQHDAFAGLRSTETLVVILEPRDETA